MRAHKNVIDFEKTYWKENRFGQCFPIIGAVKNITFPEENVHNYLHV